MILGHEINKQTFQLSQSSKERCKALFELIKNISGEDYFIIFMGLGRLQGNCKLSISECMFQFFSNKYFKPKNYILEKESVDTLGDAFFSLRLLDFIDYKNKVSIITSDWHLERVKYVFKKIFPKIIKLEFVPTNEIKKLDKKTIINLHKKQLESLTLNKSFLNRYKKEESNFLNFLKKNHTLYKNLKL